MVGLELLFCKKRYVRIFSRAKVSMSKYFGYTADLGVYPKTVSDITELYEMFAKKR